MTPARFLQYHTLTAFPGTLLNRDDAGLAKRMPFGGTSRIRISSQCLKRHWRTAEDAYSLGALGTGLAIRSRVTLERMILQPLVAEGRSEEAVRASLSAVTKEIFQKSEKAKKAEKGTSSEKTLSSLDTNQVIVLGKPEIDYIARVVRGIVSKAATAKDAATATAEWFKDKENKDNLKAMAAGAGVAGLDGALFGRMITSDVLARIDASIHVAHAFTVHSEEVETDYFSAVDDLVQEEHGQGSGHINETELTSGLFYGYCVVDVPQLVSNLQGVDRKRWLESDRALAATVVGNLIHLIATVSPGAKKGSTAPYSYAQFVMIEAGERQPRTLANAFIEAVDRRAGEGLARKAVNALVEHVKSFDRMYGQREERRFAAMLPVDDGLGATDAGSLDGLADWAAGCVR